jgi:N-acyl homoserine lactone hydrolase
MSRMKSNVFTGAPLLFAFLLGLVPLDARQRSESPMVKLYVFDCGTLKDRDPGTYNLTREQVQSTDMSDPCFLVVHSRGSLLWETGLNDAAFNRPGGGGPRGDKVDRSLKSQLEQIGFRPQSITYLAMSHSHGDHSGNANDYTAATWLVQRAEHANMFRTDAASPGADPATYAALEKSKTVLLDGDHDVFGDGTVILKATPGHTPGHQSLFVRLAKTGPLMLSGDLYHFPAERTLKKMPTREAANGQTATSREKLEAFMRDTGAALWIQHDVMAYRGLKLAPAFYD